MIDCQCITTVTALNLPVIRSALKMQNKWTWRIFAPCIVLLQLLAGCKNSPDTQQNTADLVLYNAFVYPVSGEPIAQGAVVIKDGKILTIGASEEILLKWKSHSKDLIDCSGSFLMPGIIEGHGHFSGLGNNLQHLDLLDTHDWQEIVDSVGLRAKKAKAGAWITGRGWHQEKWINPVLKNINGYPYHDILSKVSPDNPVILFHASGHALFANEAAMKIAGINPETKNPQGGRIVRDEAGYPLGVFEENAMDLIYKPYRDFLDSRSVIEQSNEWYNAISLAQQHCLKYGITTFQDAGSTYTEINKYNSMAVNDSLDLRMWVMFRQPYDTLKMHMDGLPIIRSGQDMFTCRAVKAQMDGALGSFGAWLLQPYTDKPGFVGQNTTSIEEIQQIAALAMEKGMQMCVHAIGDRGNREVLNVYANEMRNHKDKKDVRWRIEHAQHLNPDDMPRFKELDVIASMQGIHCTSDAPFVEKRLGHQRSREGAYAWRSLLDLGVNIANGTDAPVERVNPFPNIYALVTRRRLDDGQVFYVEQAMTRKEALYAYTLANAYAGFEEDIKGSLEPGKWADIVLLSQNLLTCPDDSIPETNVKMTMVGGKIKYQNNY